MTVPFPTLTTGSAAVVSRWNAYNIVQSDATALSTFTDSIGGHDFTQSGGNRPTYYQKRWPGGRPCVTFVPANSQFMTAGTAATFKFLSDGTTGYFVLAFYRTNNRLRTSAGYFPILTTGAGASTATSFTLAMDNTTADTATGESDVVITKSSAGNYVCINQIQNFQPPLASHGFAFMYDGSSTFSPYEWGVAGATSSVLHSFNNANPQTALTLGFDGSNYADIDVAEIVIISCPTALNSTDLNALFAYGEAQWNPCGSVVYEPFMDLSNVWASSNVSRNVTPLTKSGSNPLYPGGSSKLKYNSTPPDVYAPQVIRASPTDWRMWVGVQTGPLATLYPTILGSAYLTSTDGISWAEPNLGYISYDSGSGANTNNPFVNMPTDSVNWFYGGPWTIFPNNTSGQRYLVGINLIKNTAGPDYSGNGVFVYSSADGISSFTQIAALNFGSGSTFGGEEQIGGVLQRLDGRYSVWRETGQGGSTDSRNVGQWVSNTNDPAGSYTDYGDILTTADNGSVHNQWSDIWPFIHKGVWIAFGGRLDQDLSGGTTFPNGSEWIDLYVSRDEGWTWNVCQDHWIPLGGSGGSGAWDSFFIYGPCFVVDLTGEIVNVSGNMLVYYSASSLGNAANFPHTAGIGYGTVPYERIGGIVNTPAISILQTWAPQTTGGTHGASVATGTAVSNMTAGSCVVVAIASEAVTTDSVTSVTDTAGNTYTLFDSALSAVDRATLYYCLSTTNPNGVANNVITAHFTNSYAVIGAVEILPISTLDGAGSKNSGVAVGTNPTYSTGGITTTNANDILLAVLASGNASVIPVPTNFTELGKKLAATGEAFAFDYQIVSATQSALNVQWAVTTSNGDGWGAVVMALKRGTSAGGTVTCRATYQPGLQLSLNCDASAGSLTVALLDNQGVAISGFDDADFTPITTNVTSSIGSWTGGSTLPNQVLRPRYTLTNSTLYGASLVPETTSSFTATGELHATVVSKSLARSALSGTGAMNVSAVGKSLARSVMTGTGVFTVTMIGTGDGVPVGGIGTNLMFVGIGGFGTGTPPHSSGHLLAEDGSGLLTEDSNNLSRE